MSLNLVIDKNLSIIKLKTMSKDRVCVVTGANKGVGYAIVKELSKKFDGLIYLTGIIV